MAASSSSAATAATLIRITPACSPTSFKASSRVSVACRALKQQQPTDEESNPVPAVGRRLTLSLLAGVAAIAAKSAPANAAYGEAANIFGRPKTNTDYIKYNGNGFTLQIPAKWNPSKEVEYPGQVLRYEDNFDSNSNVSVMVTPTDKKSIKDYGPPERFLADVDYLLGKQTFAGKTLSEGGFDPDAVASASILEANSTTVNGKEYYSINVLTRTADGDEGGKHQLIIATVSDGKLFMCKAQAGDKRWFKGAKRYIEGTTSSFSVA